MYVCVCIQRIYHFPPLHTPHGPLRGVFPTSMCVRTEYASHTQHTYTYIHAYTSPVGATRSMFSSSSPAQATAATAPSEQSDGNCQHDSEASTSGQNTEAVNNNSAKAGSTDVRTGGGNLVKSSIDDKSDSSASIEAASVQFDQPKTPSEKQQRKVSESLLSFGLLAPSEAFKTPSDISRTLSEVTSVQKSGRDTVLASPANSFRGSVLTPIFGAKKTDGGLEAKILALEREKHVSMFFF
jgi:hypothetical protein